MYKWLISLAILSNLAFSNSAFAAEEEKWYQVEIIVFKRSAVQNATEENWIFTDLPATREEGKRLVSASTAQTVAGKKGWIPFHQTAKSNLALTTVKEKLDASNQYEVLVHTGWRQPLKSGGTVIPLRINSAELAAEDAATTGLEPSAETVDPATTSNDGVNKQPGSESLVAGNVMLKLSRYLHFAFDVYYKQTPSSKFIPWDDSRRIKLNELNYFDHPLIGIIARVTPIGDGR